MLNARIAACCSTLSIADAGISRAFSTAPRAPRLLQKRSTGLRLSYAGGWTLAWCGWQWDVVRSPVLMGLEAPQALGNGAPIQGRSWSSFSLSAGLPDHPLCDRVHRPYTVADVSNWTLCSRCAIGWTARATIIPRDRWRFARAQDGRVVADETSVWIRVSLVPDASTKSSTVRRPARGWVRTARSP